MTTTVRVIAHPADGLVCKVAQVRETDHAVVQTKFLRSGEQQDFHAHSSHSVIVSEVAADKEPPRANEQAEVAEGAAEA